ncbi:MAG TPA: hypothetical protein VFX24_06265 [Ktedonobacterales bacterium]|nr:hypothetical protein [Ktedonobacterales bacterium]
MSNSQGNKPSQQPDRLSHEPSLDALALTEWLAERRAAGDAPHLDALIATLPDAAGDLADAAMLDALVAESEADDLQAGEPPVERTSEDVTPPALSLGAQRAVADIFGAGGAEALAMVAETPAAYAVTTEAEAGAAVGLLALAAEQEMDAEALAARIMLSPEAVRWLDRVALPFDHQPDALVFHLVGALGVLRERVQEALTRGNADTDTDAATDIDADAPELAGMLTTSASLTPAQRAYWAAQLAGRG